MLTLLGAKLVATSLTHGSGGSGGIFAPSLYLGAMLGGLFGTAANALWPQATAPAGAYALVGMTAVFASAARTPVMAVVIVFEMTGDYRMVMPLLLATMVGTLLSQRLDADSIYAATLTRRGIRLHQGRDLDLLEGIAVRDAMSTAVTAAGADWPWEQMWQALVASGQHALPVTDAAGRLQGIVTARDLQLAAERLGGRPATAAEVAVTQVLVAHPDEPVSEALRRMGGRDIGQLPVVDEHSGRASAGAVEPGGHHPSLQPRRPGPPGSGRPAVGGTAPPAGGGRPCAASGERLCRRGADAGGTEAAGRLRARSRHAAGAIANPARGSAAALWRSSDGRVPARYGGGGGDGVRRSGPVGAHPLPASAPESGQVPRYVVRRLGASRSAGPTGESGGV